MADARECLKAGDVVAAMDALKAEVRRAPCDPRLRTFLFQMFCIMGDWDRALTQLNVVLELDKLALPMAQTYQAAIRCELIRESVFRGERTPLVFGDPGEWLPLLIEANRALAAGKAEQAAQLRDAAFEAAPATSGSANGVAFEWMADADPRLGPIVEALIDGKYFWVPMSAIARITIEPPEDLRDKVWMPVQFRWTNKGETIGFIPTRYPGSATDADPSVQLAKSTDWVGDADDPNGWCLPRGQRMLTTNEGDYPLMDLRTVEFSIDATDAAV